MLAATLSALRSFPDLLEAHARAVPASHLGWRPPSWDGVPSEPLTVLQQLCHVRDIEIDGYHLRLRRLLDEDEPVLASIDSLALVEPRGYDRADAAAVLAEFRAARIETLGRAAHLDERQLARRGTFEGYGPVTVRGLLHYLCSHDQQHLAGIQWLLGQIHSVAA